MACVHDMRTTTTTTTTSTHRTASASRCRVGAVCIRAHAEAVPRQQQQQQRPPAVHRALHTGSGAATAATLATHDDNDDAATWRRALRVAAVATRTRSHSRRSSSSAACTRVAAVTATPVQRCVASMRAAHGVASPVQRLSLSSPPTSLSRPCYVVATTPRCGSVYEEMTRQLLATGAWTHIALQPSPDRGALCYAPAHHNLPLSALRVHLLLAEKTTAEQVIAARRRAFQRRVARSRQMTRQPWPPCRGSVTTCDGHGASTDVPMGDDGDGAVRVVDAVPNTRVMTLKSRMVTTLLLHHHDDWHSLGRYVPRTFRVLPRQPHGGDRDALLATTLATADEHACRDAVAMTTTGACASPTPLWVAKSSYGCHGDGVAIFDGDAAGVQRMLRYIDARHNSHPWVVQRYIDRPLLYHRRKFDVRCWALLRLLPPHGRVAMYVHKELVMRMSSVEYDRGSATSSAARDRLAHITNHCVQQSSADTFARHEAGNELWKEHLDGLVRYKAAKLLAATRAASATTATTTQHNSCSVRDDDGDDASLGHVPLSRDASLRSTVMPQIHAIVRDTVRAARPHLPREHGAPATHCFQLFGYDFILDEQLHVWLLEINGAPAAAERLLSVIVADTIDLAIAPHFAHMSSSSSSSSVVADVAGGATTAMARRNGYVLVYKEA